MSLKVSSSGEKIGVWLVLLEKDFLRYECYRLIDCIWLFITLLCLLLIFEYSLICLGWIMKATCCLLRYNPALMFAIVNLSMPCLHCENAHSCI